MRSTSATPLKVKVATKDMVRYGAAVFACTQGEFVERAVAEYLDEHDGELAKRAEEVRNQAKKLRASI